MSACPVTFFPRSALVCARSRTHTRRSHDPTGNYRLLLTALIAAIMLAVLPASVAAAPVVWNGAGASNNWSEGANWVGALPPGPGDVATFDATSMKPAMIDAGFVGPVQGADIQAGYAGVVTQQIPMTFTTFGLTIAGGTYDLNGQSLAVDSNWTRTGGAFIHGNGSVVIGSATPSIITGTSTFGDLTIGDAANPKATTFAAGSTQTVDGAFLVNGAAAAIQTLRSSAPGTRWQLTLNGATNNADHVDVQDSWCSNPALITRIVTYVDSGNNGACWALGGVEPVTGLTVTAGNTQNQLSWTNPTDPAFDHVEVWRTTSAAGMSSLVYTAGGPGENSWLDTGLINNTRYKYEVRAVTALGTGATAIPGGFDAYYFSDTGYTNIRWEADEPTVDKFWSTGGPRNTVAYPGPDINTSFGTRWDSWVWIPDPATYTFHLRNWDESNAWVYIDGVSLTGGYYNWNTDTSTVYSAGVALTRGWHHVRAEHNDTGTSAGLTLSYSSPAFGQTITPASEAGRFPSGVGVPNDDALAFTYPIGGETLTGQTAVVSWTNPSSAPAPSYHRYAYSLDDGATWTAIERDEAPATSRQWQLPDSVYSTTARFRVQTRSANMWHRATWVSNQFTIDTRTVALLSNVSNFDVVSISGQNQLTWINPVEAAFDHVNIYRSTSESDIGLLVRQEPGTSWNDTGLVNDITYFYTAIAANSSNHEVNAVVAGMPHAYHANTSYSMEATLDLTPQLDLQWGNGGPRYERHYPGPEIDNGYSNVWRGYFYAPADGDYRFGLTVYDEDGADFYVDDTYMGGGFFNYNPTDAFTPVGRVTLTQGWHRLEARQYDTANYAGARFYYEGPGVAWQVVPAIVQGHHPTVTATPSDNTLTITAPTGGETWTGQRQVVTWTRTGASPAASYERYSYSLDDGATWTYAGRDYTPGSSWSWQLPAETYTTQARFKVETRNAQRRLLVYAVSNQFTVDTRTEVALGNVSGLEVVSVATENQLSWTNPVDAAFDHVNIYRSTVEQDIGVRMQQVAGTTWSDSGLTDNTTYFYTVIAANASDHEAATPDPGVPHTYHVNTSYSREAVQDLSSDLNFQWGNGGPRYPVDYPGEEINDGYSNVWGGFFYAPAEGAYHFGLTVYDEDGADFYVDDVYIGGGSFNYNPTDAFTPHGRSYLTQGWHRFEVRQYDTGNYSGARFYYEGPGVAWQTVPASELGHYARVQATSNDNVVTFTNPLGGESFLDQTELITWTVAGASPAASYTRYAFSVDDGATWRYMGRDLGVGTSFHWHLPARTSTAQGRFKVETRNASGRVLSSTVSPQFSIDTTIAAGLGNVTDLTRDATSTQVLLTWTNPPEGNFDHVNIYRSTTEFELGTVVHSTAGPGATSWTDTGRTDGTTYWYTAIAADSSGREAEQPAAGVLRTYHPVNSYDREAVSTVDPTINYAWGGSGPDWPMHYPGAPSGGNYSNIWRGQVFAPTAGAYTFSATGWSEDNFYMDIDGVRMLDHYFNWIPSSSSTIYGQIQLDVGWHRIEAWMNDPSDDAGYIASYSGPGIANQVIPAAALGHFPTVDATPSDALVAETTITGLTLFERSTYPLTFTWSGSTPAPTQMRYAYSLDDGVTWQYLTRGVAPTTSYNFTPPLDVYSTQARFKVELRDATWNVMKDYISPQFTIDTRPPAPYAQFTDPADAQSGAVNPTGIGTIDPHLSWLSGSPTNVNRQRIEVVSDSDQSVVGLYHLDSSMVDAMGRLPDMTTMAPNADTSFSASSQPYFGDSLEFDDGTDGALDSAQVPWDAQHDLDTFTVDAWFRRDSFPGADNYIVAKGAGETDTNFLIRVDSGTNQVEADLSAGGADLPALTSTTNVNDGSWHHAAFVVNSGSGTRWLYVDGQLEATDTFAGDVDNPAAAIDIGFHGSDGWHGGIDDVRIVDRAIPAAEIAGYFRTSHPHFTPAWDSDVSDTGIAFAACALDTRCADITYDDAVGDALQSANGARWYARAKFKTTTGTWSKWSTYDWFEVQSGAPSAQYSDDTDASTGTANNTDIRTATPRMTWRNNAGGDVDLQRTQVVASPNDGAVMGLWHLDGAGTDATGAGNDIALGAANTDPSFAVSGLTNHGQSLVFDDGGDGAHDQATVAYTPAFDLESFTVELRFRVDGLDGASTDNYLIAKRVSDTDTNFAIRIDEATGVIEGDVSADGAPVASLTGVDVNDGQWHHVALTVDGRTGSAELVLDGTSMDTATLAGIVDQPAVDIEIGHHGANGFEGVIDEVRISSRARDRAEIEGSIRTTQPHGTLMWDSSPGDAGEPIAVCADAARCDNVEYDVDGNPASAVPLLQGGARYHVRSKLKLVAGAWTGWSSHDWFETSLAAPSAQFTSDSDASAGSINPSDIMHVTPHLSWQNTTGSVVDGQRVQVRNDDPTGVAGHWKFNGDYLDSSGNGLHATNGGSPNDASFAGSRSGFGDYIYIDGDDDLSIPHDPSLNAPDMSIELWFYKNPFADWDRIAQKGPAYPNMDWIIWQGTSCTCLAFAVGTSSGAQTITAPYAGLQGGWHHLTVTVDAATNMTMYVDGSQVATGSYAGTRNTTTGAVWVGSQLGTSEWWTGYLDDLRILSRELQPDEILGHLNSSREHDTIMWDSSPTGLGEAMTACADATRCGDIEYDVDGNAGSALALDPDNARYFVRSRYQSAATGGMSPWTGWDWFETQRVTAPDSMFVDDVDAAVGSTNPVTITSPQPRFTWNNASALTADAQQVQVISYETETPSVTAHWRFDGDFLDDSGQGHDAGNGAPAFDSSFVAGKNAAYDQALYVDANDDTWVAHDPSLNAPDFTIEMWFNKSAIVNGARLIQKGPAWPNQDWMIYVQTGTPNLIVLSIGTSSGPVYYTADATALFGSWHHVAATIDSSNNVGFYIDGVLLSSGTFAGTRNTTAGAVWIGSSLGTSAWFDGYLDEIRIHDEARTPAQILADHDTSIPFHELYWDSSPSGAGEPMAACAGTSRCDNIRYGVDGNAGGALPLDSNNITYQVRARFGTDDTWSDWSTWDWFTVNTTMSIAVPTGGSEGFGTTLSDSDYTATSDVEVSTNAYAGYTLEATNRDDVDGMDDGAGNGIPNWTGMPATPTPWPAATAGGFGLTVTGATGGKDTARWGTGAVETDFANLKFVGPRLTSSTMLHQTAGPTAGTDTVNVGYRMNAPGSTTPGVYDTDVTYSATANP